MHNIFLIFALGHTPHKELEYAYYSSYAIPFREKKWFISSASVKDEHYAVHKDMKSSQGKCFFFLSSLFSSGVHSILWAHSTSHSRLCLLICGFHITLLQVRAGSSCGHHRSLGEAYAHPWPQEHALSSCSQPGCMCHPGQAFDKLRSN